MEKLQVLLKELNDNRKEFELKERKEDTFNIFTTLHKIHDERRLHSRFIAALLQPKGGHGKNELFLRNFLETLNAKVREVWSNEDLDFSNESLPDLSALLQNSDNIVVYPKDYDKKEFHDIDILIIDRTEKSAVIIENKIYAGDSNKPDSGQLERYIDFVIDKEGIPLNRIFTVYLSLDGHQPTDKSIGRYRKRNNWMAIRYLDLIVPWLNQCISKVDQKSLLGLSLIQYNKTIENLSGMTMSVEQVLQYKDTVTKNKENFETYRSIYDSFKHVKWHAVHEFWTKLQDRIREEKDFEIINEFSNIAIAELTHFEVYRKGQKKKQQCFIKFKTPKGYIVRVIFSAKANAFYIGIQKTETLSPEFEAKIKTLIENNPDYKKSEWNHIYMVFRKNIRFNDFSKGLTFKLIDKEFQGSILDNVWDDIQSFVIDIEQA